MKKIVGVFLVAVFACGMAISNVTAVNAAPANASALGQIVPKTKRVSRKVYHRGRKTTVVTYRHGKRITKKVWHKSWRIGKKTAHKTKVVVVGHKKRRP